MIKAIGAGGAITHATVRGDPSYVQSDRPGSVVLANRHAATEHPQRRQSGPVLYQQCRDRGDGGLQPNLLSGLQCQGK